MSAPIQDQIRSEETLPLASANIEINGKAGTPPPDMPDWINEVDHPYLHGVFAPIKTEMSSDDLEIEGEIPKDLCGVYLRNGPCQRYKPNTKYHYYDGDGMLHGIYFKDGNVSYKSKWIHTDAYIAEEKEGRNIWPGLAGPFDFSLPGSPIKDNSNTDIIFYNGKLLSLWYLSGVPYHIDPLTLDTIGPETFKGELKHTLSAHTKTDPRTGELIMFNYGNKPPYMTYGVGSADGELVYEVPIEIPGARSPHDIGLTPNYSILHDLPFFQDTDVLDTGNKRVVRFHPELPSRFGVIPRFGGSNDVKWFEAEPCYILHIINCWEDDDWVIQEGCRQPNPDYERDPVDGPLASMLALRRRVHVYHRWEFNMDTGEVRETELDSLNTEFPRVNPLYLGLKSRYSYHQYIPLPEEGSVVGRCQTFDALVKFDSETGERQFYDYGDGVYGNESPFAPRLGATDQDQEDDGYIVTFVTDTKNWRSDCVIFDARDIEKGPIARVRIPQRIPSGFHTGWVDGKDIYDL